MNFVLIYESPNGKVIMTSKNMSEYEVVWIDGLEQVIAESQTKRYVRVPGQKTLYKNPGPRAITITGVIKANKAQRRFRARKLIEVCDNTLEGTLYINMFGKLRRINCIPDTVVFSEPENDTMKFVVTLICDNPYFKDWEDIEVMLFSRVNNLITPMTFPRVFTYRYTKGYAINNGMVDVEPIIVIEAGPPTPDAPETGVLIENETTGKQILLEYAPEDGDVITIDIPARKIISSINGDITRKKPLEYRLSEFVLKRGPNTISFTNYDTGQPLIAKAIYSNLYTEAMY